MERCIELTQGSGDSSFDLPALQSYLSMRPSAYRCHPRLFEGDCLHTPYLPPPPTHGHQSSSRSPALTATLPASRSSYALEGDLLGLDDNGDGNGDSGADHGLDESEGLLARKRNHQLEEARDRERERSASFKDDEQLRRQKQRRVSTGFSTRPGSGAPQRRKSKTSLPGLANGTESGGEDEEYEEEEWVPDVFVFDYGTVVIWGMTEREEKRFLATL